MSIKAATCTARFQDLEKGRTQMNILDKNYEFGNHGAPGGDPLSSGKASMEPRPC